jgi:hypothetical protein
MHEGQVVNRSFFIAGGHPPELLEPVHTPLRPIAEPVNRSVEPRRPTAPVALGLPLLALVFPLGDHVPDPPATQGSPALRIAVAFVQRGFVGPLPRPTALPGNADAIQHRFQLGAFMALARRQAHRQRPTAPFGGEVEFGAPPAATASEGLASIREIPLFPRRPSRADDARRRRAGGRGRWRRPRSRRTSPTRPRGRPCPGATGAPAPRRRADANAAADRGRFSTGRSARADRARAHRCATPRGCH